MTVNSPLQNARGQGLVEYLIIVALIAVATIGVIRVMGQAVTSRFATISYALQGDKKKPPVDAIDETLLRKKDLGDFMNGVGSGDGAK
ncbi:hypothetical protein BH10BDE1_BH10BDE1_25560 [soil metagenome]